MFNRADKRVLLLSLSLCGAFVVVALFPSLVAATKNRSPILLPLSEPDKALLVAVKANNFTGVKQAVENGADVNVRDPERYNNCSGDFQPRRTPLMEAVCPRARTSSRSWKLLPVKMEIVDYLLERGADLNGQERNGNSILDRAILPGRANVIKSLLEHGADPNVPNKYGDTPLIQACSAGDLEMAKLLFAYGGEINCQGQLGYTALHRAVDRKYSPIASWLLSVGANPSLRTKTGWTVDHVAVNRDWMREWTELTTSAHLKGGKV